MSQLMRLLSLNSRLCGKRLQNAIPTTGVKVSPSQLRLFSEARMSKIQRTAASDMFGLDRGTRTPLQDLLRILNDQVQRYGRVLTRTVEDAISRAEQRGFVGLAETQVLLRATGSFIKDSPPSKRQQLAAKVWELTPKQNLDISHYNTLLHIHLENGVEFDPSDFLQQLSDAGVAPNRVTYQRLVQRYCVMGDIKNAKKIIEFMKAQDLPITDKVFHSLIIGHLKAGDPESARSIPKLMESALMKPSTETFTVLAEGLIEAGDIQGAFEVIADQQLLDEQILRIAKALALKDDQNAVEKILGSLSDSVVNHVSAKNICSELLVAGKLDAAALIFKKTHVRVLRRNDANFLVVTAAKTGARVEDVLRLLEEVKEDTSPNVFVEATRGAITTGNRDVAEEYIAKLSEMGYPIRAHYYLPFLCRCSDEDDVYKELKFMASIEKPSQDLIFDFVIPRVDCGDPERLYNKLVEAGTEPDVAGTVVAYHLIKNERFEDCEKHLQVHQITRVGSLAALLGELVQMEDLPIAIHILECLAKCAHKTTSDVDVVGQFLEKVVHCKNQAIEAVSKTDLPLSKYCFDRLLKAGLKCESLRRNVVDMPGMEESEYVVSAQRVEELETLLDREENTGKDVTFLLKRLLVLYCRERSSEKVEETLRKLPLDSMQGGIISALVEYYCSQSDPDHALSFILRANDRGITLNPNRILGTARALVKQNRLEDAHELMAKFLRASIAQQDARTDISAANLLLEVYNHYGSEKCIETYDHYLRNHVGLRVIGHAVKSTIDKDITKALELVEGIAERYRDVPCRRLLCKRLIEHNMIDEFNATISLLRKFTPESEINSIMLLSYLECGKIEEAKDALLRLRGGFGRRSLMRACTAYFNSGEIDGLEKLLELMEELKVETDVAMLYRIKLLSMENKVDEAMELWTQSQEENIICVPLALQILSELLQRNGRDVPFVVPDVRDVFAPTDSKNPRFEDILQESVDAALEYRVKLKEDNRTLEMRHMQSLIHELVNVNRVKEAFDVIGDLEDVSKFNDRYKVVLKRLLTAAATQGMVEELEAFHESAGRKFGSHALQRAYFVKGNLDEFVSKLENSPLEKVEFYISPDFFVIDSPLAARLETLAHRLASEKRSYARVIDLWYLYIAQSRMEKAAELIEKYPDMVRYMETLRIRPQVKKVFDLGFLNRVAQVMNNSAVRRKVCLCAAAQLLQDGQLDEANKCIDRGIELGFELNQFPSRIMKALGREAPDAAYKNTNEHEADEEEQRAQSA